MASRSGKTPTRTKASKAKSPARSPGKAAARRVVLLVATRKGAWLLRGDAARRSGRVDGPHFLGHIVNHMVSRPA